MTPVEWERIFEALADPLLVLDPTGVALRLSGRLQALLARPHDPGVGIHWQALLEPRGRPDTWPIAVALASGETRVAEQSFGRLGGVWLVAASSYRDAAGRPAGVVATLHDVTAARQQQQRVLEAARLAEVGHLAGGVAHEINTPLASIALRAESLLRRCQDPELASVPAFERFPRYLETIDREIFRCKRIITSLLEFARSGQAEIRATDLNALLRTAVNLVEHAARRRGASFDLALDPALPAVQADPAQLRQVALALLLNAVEVSGEGDAIGVVTGVAREDEVFLEVTDAGPGVPEESRERIFSPFYTTKSATRSTGLGLAVCRQVVAAHEGRIDVTDRPGGGSRFRVSLPVRGTVPGEER